MGRSTVAMLAALVSILMHLGLITVTTCALLHELKQRKTFKHKRDSHFFPHIGVMVVLLISALLVEATVFISSVSVVIGIKKKWPPFIVPWLYLTIAYMILSIADFIGGYNALGYLFPVKLVVATIHITLWYPIFKYLGYLRLRLSEESNYVY